MGYTRQQTWQVVNQEELEVLETSQREPLSNLNKILDSKLDYPFRFSLEGSEILIKSSEVQTIKSDGSGDFENSYKVAPSPIQGRYKKIEESTLNLINGATTGDFASNQTTSAPSVGAEEYIRLGIELRTNGRFYLVWGTPSSDPELATDPIFTSGDSVCLMLLRKDAISGQWGFQNPSLEDIILFKESNALEIREDAVHKVKVIDLVRTSLPTGSSVTLDGTTILNDDLVLFTRTPIEGLYRAKGIGSSVEWVKILEPRNGANVQVTDGTSYLRTIWKRIQSIWKPLEVADAVKEPTGFPNRVDSELSFDNSTRTLTIQPSSLSAIPGAFDYFAKGRVFRVNEPKTYQIPDDVGSHFVYFDDHDLDSQQVFNEFMITEKVYVAYIYWNGSEAVVVGDERHGITMDGATHKYLHLTKGTVLQSGLELGFFQLDGSGNDEEDTQISLSRGRVFDEDIDFTIDDISNTDPLVIHKQPLNQPAQIPMYYKSGTEGTWMKTPATNSPVRTGTDRIEYNYYDGGTWNLAEASDDDYYITTWVFATNSIIDPIIGITGQAEHDSLSEAQEKEVYASIQFGEFPASEFKLLYRLIWQTNSSYGNSAKARLVDIKDLRVSPDSPFPSVSLHHHGLLTGLADPDHAPTAVTTSGVPKDGLFSNSDHDVQQALRTLNNALGQLRLKKHPSSLTRVIITGTDRVLNSDVTLSQAIGSLLLKFEGAEIDFQDGSVYESDGSTPLGVNFTPPTIPSNHYFWYSVTLIANALDPDSNRITGQVLVLPAPSSDLILDEAPRAPFANGLKLGQVAVQFNGTGINEILEENIIQLGVGSGGGGDGTGDANELLERLKNRLESSSYQYVTPNIFSTTADSETDPSTSAIFSIVSNTYTFENIDDIYLSINSIDPLYLANSENEIITDLDKIEIIAYYDIDNFDEDAIYEVSRDSGVNWQAVSMERIGLSDTLRGLHTFTPEPTDSFTQQFGLAVSGNFDLNATNRGERLINLFTTAFIRNIRAQIGVVGSPTGTLTAKIVKNISGSPSTDPNDVLAYSKPHFIDGSSTGFVDFEILAPLAEGSYFVLFETDTIYKNNFSASLGSNRIFMNRDPLGPTSIIFTFEGRALDLRLRIQGKTEGAGLKGYGIFYKVDSNYGVTTSDFFEHRVEFDGVTENLSTFNLPFLPDKRLLKVYEIGTIGKVYRHGAFGIDGYNVVFPPYTFSKPGTVRLLFEQTTTSGGGFSNVDTTDRNFSLLMANNLGSTDTDLDLSSNGRGIFLRRPDGTLREIAIDNDDNIVIYSI